MKQHIGGYSFDAYTTDEAKKDLAELGHHFGAMIREELRGVKPMKLPILTGQASTTTLVLPPSGGSEPVSCGPEQGYFWRIGRVTVSSNGADAGAVSLFAGSDPGNTGQQFLVDNTLKVGAAYYPGSRGLFLWPGDFLYASITSVSGNTYRLSGIAIEVPAEMAGKILA